MSACVISLGHLSRLPLIPLPKNVDDGARGIVEMLFFYVTYRSCGRCGPAIV